MLFTLISLLAGFLTVITPCVLPLLPVVLAAAVGDNGKKSFQVILGLVVSVFLVTFLLKVSSVFINIPSFFWSYLSGGILIFVGLSFLYPNFWYKTVSFFGLTKYSSLSIKNTSKYRNYILGAALGPVFSTCSPTYFLILATVIPVSFSLGVFYILVYLLGLTFSLVLISKLGDSFVNKINDNQNVMKKMYLVFGVTLLILGFLIVSGYDKVLQAKLPGSQTVVEIENKLLENVKLERPENMQDKKIEKIEYKIIGKAKDFQSYSGQLNTSETSLNDILKKNKVVLFEFWTYSCINCKRTIPYLNDWYEKYGDKGFEIVSVHTPEFAFEKNIDNVRKASAEMGVKFPIFLDNDFKIWNSYDNSYWPNRFLILPNGDIIYNKIGEGDYENNEQIIKNIVENN